MTEEKEDLVFIERVARPLRAPEQADSSFRARVMAAVNGMTREQELPESARLSPSSGIRVFEHRPRSWWVRPYWIRVTPMTLMAAAAVLAVIGIGIVKLRPAARVLPATVTPPVATVRETVHDTV